MMFEWFAKRQGVDISKFQVVNTATPGLIGFALADRADAVQLWEPAYTMLISKKPDIRTLDVGTRRPGRPSPAASRIPYLGVAAHPDWSTQNKAVTKLYTTYARPPSGSSRTPRRRPR